MNVNMAEGLKKRKSNFSPEEIGTLMKSVGKNYDVLYGECSKRAVYKEARHSAWLDVTDEVNQVSMEKRTLQEVKNKWKKCQHLYRGDDELYDDFDCMPLEQRLRTTSRLSVQSDPERMLQSQPLSPTKLKVTRQSKPAAAQPVVKPPTPVPVEEVCLKWSNQHSDMRLMFPNLLLREQHVDATLVAEGKTIKCHRVILSSSSTYFEEVLSGIAPFQHPVLFMKDVPFWVLKCLCDYIYSGEVNVLQTKVEELLTAADSLKIKGLARNLEGPKEEPEKKEAAEPPKEEKKEQATEEKEPKATRKAAPADMPVLKSAKLPKATHQQHTEMPVLKSSKTLRSTAVRREKMERMAASKEPISKKNILDPFDLLEPVYEEVQKEPKAANSTAKPKETKAVPVKKSVQKRIRKRKLSDSREESPAPVLSKKGTRSRPHRKIPRFYQSPFKKNHKVTYEPLEALESTIVREPHTDQAAQADRVRPPQSDEPPQPDPADPLMQMVDIKTEPLDLDESAIEIEDNDMCFSDHDISLHEEELVESYEAPAAAKRSESNPFKKIKVRQRRPLLVDVHDVNEKDGNLVHIVDVAQIKNTGGNDPLNDLRAGEITIASVRSLVESRDDSMGSTCEEIGFKISEVRTQAEDGVEKNAESELGFQIGGKHDVEDFRMSEESNHLVEQDSLKIVSVECAAVDAEQSLNNIQITNITSVDDASNEKIDNSSEVKTKEGLQRNEEEIVVQFESEAKTTLQHSEKLKGKTAGMSQNDEIATVSEGEKRTDGDTDCNVAASNVGSEVEGEKLTPEAEDTSTVSCPDVDVPIMEEPKILDVKCTDDGGGGTDCDVAASNEVEGENLTSETEAVESSSVNSNVDVPLSEQPKILDAKTTEGDTDASITKQSTKEENLTSEAVESSAPDVDMPLLEEPKIACELETTQNLPENSRLLQPAIPNELESVVRYPFVQADGNSTNEFLERCEKFMNFGEPRIEKIELSDVEKLDLTADAPTDATTEVDDAVSVQEAVEPKRSELSSVVESVAILNNFDCASEMTEYPVADSASAVPVAEVAYDPGAICFPGEGVYYNPGFHIAPGGSGQGAGKQTDSCGSSIPNDSELENIVNDLSKMVSESQLE